MEQNHIQFPFKARYFQFGELNQDTENLIFAIHGYGQQAKYFLKKFESINNGHNCVIAPEGLSKFYLEGFSGRVGATWMTKEDRLTDIENYINYLNQLYESIKSDINKNVKVTLLGFSQGSATVSRWAAASVVQFHQLVLWAGIFPPDMEFSNVSKILYDKNIFYVYGLQDQFITKERMEEMKELSSKLKIKANVVNFDGGHEINSEILNQFFL